MFGPAVLNYNYKDCNMETIISSPGHAHSADGLIIFVIGQNTPVLPIIF